jgi:hypothetical protein
LVLGNELGGDLVEGLLDILLHAAAHTRGAQEEAVEDSADVVVEFENGPDDAAALELPVGFPCPSQNEEEEDDIS